MKYLFTAISVLLFASFLSATTIPITGGAGSFAGGEEFSMSVYGPGFGVGGSTPDAPNHIEGLQGYAYTWPSPQDSGGFLNNLTASYVSASLAWQPTSYYDLSGFFALSDVPVTFMGSAEGFSASGSELFDLTFSGTGTASFVGYGDDGGAVVFSANLGISAGEATIEYEATPEPLAAVLLLIGTPLIFLKQRKDREARTF